jgi:ParB family chromosome partitioning protein
MNPLPIKRIPLKLIDQDDHTFSLVPFDDPPDKTLSRHIAATGILHPPLLKETEAGAYLIVAGRKRLQIVNDRLKWTDCLCLVVGAEVDTLATLALTFDEALLQGPISPLTKAVFFKKALALCPPEEAARRFLPLLGLTPHPYHLQQIISLAELEPPLALALHHGRLDEKTALAMIDLSFRDRLALFDLIDTLHLSVSNQRKIATICRDLAKRGGGTSIHAILAGHDLKEIIDHPEANPPQKTAQVMHCLVGKHSPNLTTAENSFAEMINRLNLPKGVSLNHSPAFEKDELTLTATFKNQADFDRYWPELAAIFTKDGGDTR